MLHERFVLLQVKSNKVFIVWLVQYPSEDQTKYIFRVFWEEKQTLLHGKEAVSVGNSVEGFKFHLKDEMLVVNSDTGVLLIDMKHNRMIKYHSQIDGITDVIIGENTKTLYCIANGQDGTNIVYSVELDENFEERTVTVLVENVFVTRILFVNGNHRGLVVLWTFSCKFDDAKELRFSFLPIGGTQRAIQYYIPIEMESSTACTISPNHNCIALRVWNENKSWKANSAVGILNLDDFVQAQQLFIQSSATDSIHSIFLKLEGKNQHVNELIGWNNNQSKFYYSELHNFNMGIYEYSLESCTSCLYTIEKGNTSSLHISDNILFGISSDIWHPKHIFYGNIDNTLNLQFSKIYVNRGFTSNISICTTEYNRLNISSEQISWESNGYIIESLLLLPNKMSTDSPNLIVSVHGGPDYLWTYFNFEDDEKPVDYEFLLQNNYLCLFPNISGSTGRGQKFRDIVANGEWKISIKDVLKGIQFMINEYNVDPAKVSIFGWSYGGFIGAHLLLEQKLYDKDNHQYPFHCENIIIGSPVIDLYELEKTTSFPSFFKDFFSHIDEIRYEKFEQQSPYNVIKNALESGQRIYPKILILHGELDTTIPIQQSKLLCELLDKYNIEYEFKAFKNQTHYPSFNTPKARNSIRSKISTFLSQ